jgi:hypothetical protein
VTSDRSATLPQRAAPVGIAALPGFRTLLSRRFRILLAATLLVSAAMLLGLLLIRQAADPHGQYAIDLAAYHAAAARLAAGGSPYGEALVSGPIAAQGAGNYLYPPVLAQLLAPLAALPLGPLSIGWLVTQLAAIYAAMLLGLRLGRGPGPLGFEPLLWAGVASLWFLPAFDTLWKGNVSGFLSLQVILLAAGGAVGGAALAAGVLLKMAPITFGPLALVGGRRLLRAASVTGAIGLTASVLLAPAAWAEYLRVLPNLFSGDATQANNLSPWAMSMTLGTPAQVGGALRSVSIVAAIVCALAAVRVGARAGGLHAGVVLGTVAMLLLPAQLWYHYLIVLLPLAALAWRRGGNRLRSAMLVSAGAVSAGIAWLPLATVGACCLVACVLAALWPEGIPAQNANPAQTAAAPRLPA